MESFFFNITDTSYKITKYDGYKRVDISNGVVFLQSDSDAVVNIKNLDRMIIISLTQKESFSIYDHISNKNFISNPEHSDIYISSKQNITLNIKKDTFILFIADFFLKRYLSSDQNEPIDFLYNKIQSNISMDILDSKPSDALSLYLIDKIKKSHTKMTSIRCEQYIIEFMIHRFLQLDIIDPIIASEDIKIAQKAKSILIKEFAKAPTISQLAHLCATNESKLKKSFKKVYKITLYHYTQKRRLEVANLLLKEGFLTIKEIATKVGYKHQGHFSNLFYKNFGIYPKDLLKKNSNRDKK